MALATRRRTGYVSLPHSCWGSDTMWAARRHATWLSKTDESIRRCTGDDFTEMEWMKKRYELKMDVFTLSAGQEQAGPILNRTIR